MVAQNKKLKEVLKQPETVLFIGSGVSAWSGLPTWKKLIQDLGKYRTEKELPCNLLNHALDEGNLLQAASYGFDGLTRNEKAEFIKSTYHNKNIKPRKIHKKIVSLGPKCFITTNYDDLIEQSLRQEGRPINGIVTNTNSHMGEMAEIIRASARNFVFKPHGDASVIDSIILTREHYRELMPNGERHSALETLKIILVTRPVVYIGFGLRDPDFAYLRDIVANLYQGAIHDHYAIMADVTDEEVKYWSKHDSIHLVKYETTPTTNNSSGHKELLTLLNQLSE